MYRYSLKQININLVLHSYEDLINGTQFHLKELDEIPEDLKAISINDAEMLMVLGTNGLHFLNTVLRYGGIEGYSLSAEQEWEIYCTCDGFGELSSEELKEINDGWDWSHIRDSSFEALLKAEHLAKKFLIDIYNSK